MGSVSRWVAGAVLGGMFTAACARPVEGETEALPLATSRQSLTSLGSALSLDVHGGTIPSAPAELVVAGERVFFSADDGVTGRELYVSDGTPQGTVRVKDVFPGAQSSNPHGLAVLGDSVYFFADYTPVAQGQGPASRTPSLWKSDGTEAGTVHVRAVRTYVWDQRLVAVGNQLFFLNVDDGGAEVWKTDGTAQGTVRVKDLRPGSTSSYPQRLTSIGGALYFVASVADNEYSLWKSDGTEAGTVRIGPGDTFYFGGAESRVYFIAYAQQGEQRIAELWVSDGTDVGTARVVRLGTDFSPPVWMTGARGRLYMQLNNGELWTSDGTEEGTLRLRSFQRPSYSAGSYVTVGGSLYFTADDGTHGWEVWASNGTAESTRLLVDLMPGAQGSMPLELRSGGASGLLYFRANDGVHGRELWRSNGLDTALVKDLVPGALESAPEPLVTTASGLTHFFRATDGQHGQELWKTDGTAEGTTLLKDIATSPAGSNVTDFTRLGTQYFFAADDALHGRELWVTDGTLEGTRRVRDFRPGLASSNPRELITWGGALYFVADNDEGYEDLWKTDGTAAGTVRFTAPARVRTRGLHGFLELGGQLLFMEGQAHFWKTDGTQEGTVRYAQSRPETSPSGTGQYEPRVLSNGALYSMAVTTEHGLELWRTDGTASGTVLVKDLRPGQPYGEPRFLTDVNGTLFFAATEGNEGQTGLWKSDGTEAGTVRLASMATSTNNALFSRDQLAAFGGALYFVKQVDFTRHELWKTDGTAGGTVLVRPLPATGNSEVDALKAVGQTLFFAAEGPNGRELWKTDGTPEGTREVKDIRPPRRPDAVEPGSPPTALTELEGQLYFAFGDGITGEELWKSDGTAEGTVRVLDLNPGSASSRPRGLVQLADGLLVIADDGVTGYEPRILAPSSVTCPAPAPQEATSAEGARVLYLPAVLADGVPASTPIQYSPPSGSTFPLGDTTVNVTADAPGFRVRSCAFAVTVADTTAPDLWCNPISVVETPEPVAVDFSPFIRVSDSVSTPQVTYSVPNGSVLPLERTTVHVTATDAAGNTSTCSLSINVRPHVVDPGPPPDAGGDSGCGCDSTSPALAWWLLFLLVPVMRRRVARASSQD
ncbi:ELWxxDGT repeat protein [Pyxidicoccus sp. 3LG]